MNSLIRGMVRRNVIVLTHNIAMYNIIFVAILVLILFGNVYIPMSQQQKPKTASRKVYARIRVRP